MHVCVQIRHAQKKKNVQWVNFLNGNLYVYLYTNSETSNIIPASDYDTLTRQSRSREKVSMQAREEMKIIGGGKSNVMTLKEKQKYSQTIMY